MTHIVNDTARKMLRHVVPRREVSVIVASLGRSGSTLLWDAVARAFVPSWLASLSGRAHRIYQAEAWNLTSCPFTPGLVYKTHDYPPDRPLPGYSRCLFIYGDPVEIVLSVKGMEAQHGRAWVAHHFRNLRADFAGYDAIARRDVLGLERQFDAWTEFASRCAASAETGRVMAIHHKDIWSRKETIDTFVGAVIDLPPYRARAASPGDIDPNLIAQLELTYAHLTDKISAYRHAC